MATDDKYDRQLRLWGPHGQRALMHAHILLINADGTGTETLKNLVLPGVGKFTIMDHRVVTENDCSASFFMTTDDLGQNKGKVACSSLAELNPDVSGSYCESNVADVLADPSGGVYLKGFSLVIASNLEESLLMKLSDLCATQDIHLVSVRAYGLIGSCRLQVTDHQIIESKPSPDIPDLRILNPFEELIAYCSSIDFKALSEKEHAHMPYIVILIRALQVWKQKHGSCPADMAQREEFKKVVTEMSRHPELLGTPGEEVNFSEAIREIFQSTRRRELPEVVESFKLDVNNISGGKITDFELLVAALQQFIAMNGVGPLNGTIPDLTSTTELFLQIQEVYQRRAVIDRARMKGIVENICTSLRGTNPSVELPDISDELIDRFCKNIYNLIRLSTNTISEERTTPNRGTIKEAIMDTYEDPKQTPILWYLALKAADKFHSKTSRYPGQGEDGNSLDNIGRDAESVWLELQTLAATGDEDNGDDAMMEEDGGWTPPSLKSLLSKDHALEITRVGACEIHNIAALIGGIASQEIVKIITKQYIPMNNTYIYNGIAGVGATYEL